MGGGGLKVSQSSGDKNSYWINLLRYLRYLSETIWDCVGVTLNKSTSTCIKPTQPKFLTTGLGHLEIVANVPFYVHQNLRIQRSTSAFWFIEFSLFWQTVNIDYDFSGAGSYYYTWRREGKWAIEFFRNV